MPKKAEWPSEIWPVKPISRFSDSAAKERMSASVTWFRRKMSKLRGG